MFEAIISACKELDRFGLPRAVGRIDADRLIYVNESFLHATGLSKDEISGLALSAIVRIHVTSPDPVKTGCLVPITLRLPDKQATISGHAAFNENGLVYLMLVLPTEPSAEYEAAMAVNSEEERQQIARYVHEHIAPELLAVVFSIESIRLELDEHNSPAAAKFKELGERLTKLIEPVFRSTESATCGTELRGKLVG
jgi:signal transduction histidine kinase